MGIAHMDGSLVIMENTLYTKIVKKMMCYIIIGLVLTMTVDYLINKLEIDEAKFTNTERIISIIIWPLIVIISIFVVIKSKNKKNKNK
jgi:hypothetical protein